MLTKLVSDMEFDTHNSFEVDKLKQRTVMNDDTLRAIKSIKQKMLLGLNVVNNEKNLDIFWMKQRIDVFVNKQSNVQNMVNELTEDLEKLQVQ